MLYCFVLLENSFYDNLLKYAQLFIYLFKWKRYVNNKHPRAIIENTILYIFKDSLFRKFLAIHSLFMVTFSS